MRIEEVEVEATPTPSKILRVMNSILEGDGSGAEMEIQPIDVHYFAYSAMSSSGDATCRQTSEYFALFRPRQNGAFCYSPLISCKSKSNISPVCGRAVEQRWDRYKAMEKKIGH